MQLINYLSDCPAVGLLESRTCKNRCRHPFVKRQLAAADEFADDMRQGLSGVGVSKQGGTGAHLRVPVRIQGC